MLVIIIIYILNSVMFTNENSLHNYDEINLLCLEFAISEKINNEQIYDSIDDFPYDSMAVVDVKRVNDFMNNNNVSLKQNQFDAIVCLIFNYPAALSSSPDFGVELVKGIN